MKSIVVCAVLIGASPVRADPPPDPPPRSIVVLSSTGLSFSLGERRVANLAPPSAELRFGWRTRHCLRITVDASVIGYAFPEKIVAFGAGVRLHPLPALSALRHLFVRVGTHALAARGFDAALGAETGFAVEHARLIGWLAIAVDRFLVQPRAVARIRAGVGVQF